MTYCPTCGTYRSRPCEDCDGDECTMNCGPATINVRGIFDAADAEIAHSDALNDRSGDIRAAGVNSMMKRLGLYELWQACRQEQSA